MNGREVIDPTHTYIRVHNGEVVERKGWQPGIDPIPDTPASRAVAANLRDVLRRLEGELLETARKATMDFIIANFPNAQTIRGDQFSIKDGWYRRFIEADDKNYGVFYSFKTKTVLEVPLNLDVETIERMRRTVTEQSEIAKRAREETGRAEARSKRAAKVERLERELAQARAALEVAQ
jgi:hypothetical protein